MIYMNLKRLRNQHQYTQEMLAEKLGVSRQVIASGNEETLLQI